MIEKPYTNILSVIAIDFLDNSKPGIFGGLQNVAEPWFGTAKILATPPIFINVPTRELLAGETRRSSV